MKIQYSYFTIWQVISQEVIEQLWLCHEVMNTENTLLPFHNYLVLLSAYAYISSWLIICAILASETPIYAFHLLLHLHILYNIPRPLYHSSDLIFITVSPHCHSTMPGDIAPSSPQPVIFHFSLCCAAMKWLHFHFICLLICNETMALHTPLSIYVWNNKSANL